MSERAPKGQRVRILAGYWLFEGAMSLVVALPLRAVAERAYGDHPEGDAVLFHPGSLELAELVYRFDPTSAMLPSLVAVVVLLTVVAGHLPLAATIAALSRKRDVARAAASSFWRMLAVFAAFGAARVLTLVVGALVAMWVDDSFRIARGEVSALTWASVALAPFLVAQWPLAVAEDYAYVAVARGAGFLRALHEVRARLRDMALAPLLHYAARGVSQVALLAASSIVAGSLGGRGGAALIALFCVHQVVQLGRIALRVSWLEYVVERYRSASR